MPRNFFKPLKISDILTMDDNEFIKNVSARNNFSFRGKKRRFKYRTTNELVDELIHYLDVRKKQNILSVAGSGIQLFEMLTKPNKMPRIIIAFDYSPKQIAYNYLLKAGIKNLDFKTFRAYFGISKGKINNIKIRKNIIGMVPERYRMHLPLRHKFNKRDLLLNSFNNASFFTEERKFSTLKKNIERIKFFEYEVHYKNLCLSSIFTPNSFDRVYLSNILDWLCWHNKEILGYKPLMAIYGDIKKIVRKNGFIFLSNLLTRESRVPDFLLKMKVIQRKKYRIYKYLWQNCKVACN
jgi:hypothetical protein